MALPALATSFGGGTTFSDHAFNGLGTGAMHPVEASGEACPLPNTPTDVHDPELESYAHNDPVTSSTDRGSHATDATQATGTKQPTFKDPCDAGKVNGVACYDGDGGDYLQASWTPSESQPGMVCAVYHHDVGTTGQYLWASVNPSTARNDLFTSTGPVLSMFAGTQFNTADAVVVDQYNWVCATYNGVSSSFVFNGGSPQTGNAGGQAMEGLTLLAYGGGTNATNGGLVFAARWASGDIPAVADVETAFECKFGSTWPAEQLGGAYARPDPRDKEPAAVLVDVTPDVKRYAVAMRRRGMTGKQIVARLRARKGISRAKAVEMAKRVRGRRGRDPDTLHSRQVGLLAAAGRIAVANAAVAGALCKPLSDETDDSAAGCLATEAASLHETFCAPKTSGPVLAFGARLRATAAEAVMLRDAATSTPGLRAFGGADDAEYDRQLQILGGKLPAPTALARCVVAP